MSQNRIVALRPQELAFSRTVFFRPVLANVNSCVGVCLSYLLNRMTKEAIDSVQSRHAKEKPDKLLGRGTDILSEETQRQLGIEISYLEEIYLLNRSRFLLLVAYESEGETHHHMIIASFIRHGEDFFVEYVCPISNKQMHVVVEQRRFEICDDEKGFIFFPQSFASGFPKRDAIRGCAVFSVTQRGSS